jgi:hypothetical protein
MDDDNDGDNDSKANKRRSAILCRRVFNGGMGMPPYDTVEMNETCH